MVAAGLVLSLLAASVAGFEFFVERQDGRGACVSNEREYWKKDLVPLYDLQNGVVPEEREEAWLSGWQLQRLRIYTQTSTRLHLENKMAATDGSERFASVARVKDPKFLALAANATLLFSENEDWRQGKCARVHLNQLDPETGRKATWAEFCTDLSAKDEECHFLNSSVDNTEGVDVLSDGSKWTYLILRQYEENLTLATVNDKILAKWNTMNDSWFEPKFLFARTDSAPGAFFFNFDTSARPIHGQAENSLSRSFALGPEGQLCLDLGWGWKGDVGRFELLDAAGEVVRQGRLSADNNYRTRLRFDLGRGGDFQLRLRDLTENVDRVGACAGEFKMWSNTSGCVVFEGDYAFEKAPKATLLSAPANASVKVDLTPGQLKEVCAALEVKPDDPALKFSSRWGSAFKKCPQSG